MNPVKCWLAQKIIETFDLCWKILQWMAGRPLPVKEHYYVMEFFRFFFRTYPVRIAYANPVTPHRTIELQVDLCENNQQWFFRRTWEYELTELRVLAEGMREAEMFVDAGSNIGIFALAMAQTFPDKRVVAVEPLGKNFRRLLDNISANHLTHCEARQSAVTDAASPVRFHVNPIHDGGGSLVRPIMYRTGDVEFDAERYQRRHAEFQPWVEVEAVRLDAMIDRPCVVKIDVEGAEVAAVRSAVGAIEAGWVDLVVIEVQRHTAAEVLRLLAPFHFDALTLPEGTPFPGADACDRFTKNIVCVRRGAAAARRVGRMWG